MFLKSNLGYISGIRRYRAPPSPTSIPFYIRDDDFIIVRMSRSKLVTKVKEKITTQLIIENKEESPGYHDIMTLQSHFDRICYLVKNAIFYLI